MCGLRFFAFFVISKIFITVNNQLYKIANFYVEKCMTEFRHSNVSETTFRVKAFSGRMLRSPQNFLCIIEHKSMVFNNIDRLKLVFCGVKMGTAIKTERFKLNDKI